MRAITEDQAVCTVVVTVDAEPGLMPDLEAHARMGVERFGECEGYLGGALHRSADGARLVQYVQWQSEAHYEACRDNAQWDGLDSTQRFMELIASGQARVDARVYEVVATSSGE